ncbi:MAG TPA: hypothetical protein PLT49_11360, partial [Ferruginibacter sp.]|nr:hypothetical protein [Ferruginibacter sp.]HNF44264.1 hypothetical protein [Ferruginibacter sp.]HNJ93839.1 hypothetical protein [Ferruginibacter sp.]
MLGLILLSVFGFVLVMLTVLTYYLHALEKRIQADDDAGLNVETKKEEIASSQAFTYTALVLVSIGMAASFYIYVQGTPWEAHLMEWLNI